MKLLFVCLGNICRSPLGEGIMRSLVEKYKLDIVVDSAGTSAFHVGELPDKRSIAIAESHGIDLRNQRSRQFVESDFDSFDVIFAMDHQNLESIKNLYKNQPVQMYLLREFDRQADSQDVPDPYYGGDRGFKECFEMIERACISFLCDKNLIKC